MAQSLIKLINKEIYCAEPENPPNNIDDSLTRVVKNTIETRIGILIGSFGGIFKDLLKNLEK